MRAIATTSFLALLLLATGCASVDPTDPNHFTDVLVRNDTPASVVIVQCGTSCDSLYDRTTVDSAHTATVNVSNEGIAVGYLVERPSGTKLGCLYMRFNGVRRTPVVNISSLGRCH